MTEKCEFCCDGHFITSVTVRSSVIIEKIKISYTDTLKPPKYCPECGRKLEYNKERK